MEKKYIFGPINSRRFGLSLGIDLSPDQKSCNFDCLYCELSIAQTVNQINNPPLIDEIIKQIEVAIDKYPNLEVLTITANGEPTLFKDLKELVKRINSIKRDKKLLILSNASTINDPKVQDALMDIDIVKLSLDCASEDCYKKLDRPLDGYKLSDIIEGMQSFKQKFKGKLVVEILLVKGINDKMEQMRELNRVLHTIKPDRIDLGTIDRPPSYAVEGVTEQKLEELSRAFEGLPLHLVRKNPPKSKVDFNKDTLLETIKLRPQSEDDVSQLFSEQSKKILQELIDEKEVIIKEIAGIKFFISSKNQNRKRGR